MKKLLDWVKGSPSPKRLAQTRFVCIPREEYELLQIAAWNRGQRAEAQKRLKTLNAWKLNNDL